MIVLRWLVPFVAVFLAAGIFALQPQSDALSELEAAVARLKDEYVSKKKQAVNLDLHRQQLVELDRTFGELLREVPNRYDAGFTEVLRAARKRGVRIDELRPERTEVTREFYAELRATLRASGRYHDLGRFAADLAAAPGSLHMAQLSLDASPPGQVTMAATLRTFRYRDDEEVAAERKRAAKGAKR